MSNLTPGPPKSRKTAPTTFCYICGRPYGSKSISIHEPNCLEQFHIENNKLPKSKRRATPVKPEVVRAADGSIDTEKTNEILWQNAQDLMIDCEFCGRHFEQDRLEVHNRSCTAENPAKKVEVKKKAKSKSRESSVNRVKRSPSNPPAKAFSNDKWKN